MVGSTLHLWTLKRGHLRCCHERQPTVVGFRPPGLREIIVGGGEGEIGGISVPLCLVLIRDDSLAIRKSFL